VTCCCDSFAFVGKTLLNPTLWEKEYNNSKHRETDRKKSNLSDFFSSSFLQCYWQNAKSQTMNEQEELN
jgi:hypothetical protein